MLHFFVLLKPKQAKILHILNKSVFFQFIDTRQSLYHLKNLMEIILRQTEQI